MCYRVLLIAALAWVAACAGVEPGAAMVPGPYDAFECPDTPRAFVYGADDSVSAWLEAAGFDVQPLPVDRSPETLRGLVVLPSGTASSSEYAAYMSREAEALYAFVDSANVLLQLAQDAQAEVSPPFLPTTQRATRRSGSAASARVQRMEHPLVPRGLERDQLLPWMSGPVAESYFERHDGFEPLLADDDGHALLLEGAYGQGRIVLSELAWDRAYTAGAESAARAQTWAEQLRGYVAAVCERSGGAIDLQRRGLADVLRSDSEVLAVLPDTQVYSVRLPGVFVAQTSWIATNAERFRIRYAIHLGDIVDNNTPVEWERAAQAMDLLEGVVPYALVPGNHDYGPAGDASSRETLLNDYFSAPPSPSQPGYGGAYEEGKLDNTYHYVDVGGRQLLLIALEWGPRDEVIEWADGLMRTHPDHQGLLVTHAYLNNNDRRYDHTDTNYPQRFNPHEYATPGGVNDGEELWQKLVRHHSFLLVLNGHVLGDGEGYLASTTDTGTICHQMLSNYQMRDLGGDGYLRLLEFTADGRTLRVHTYSPLYDAFLQEPRQQFSISLEE